ncbi:MAG: hypothetical protein ABSD29_03990 [Verrucomicrobiota bacterium]|jgi:hypothetical protein
MKFIATHSFRNVGGKIKVENALHPEHIHKGAIFEIGTEPTLKALAKADHKNGELAARLLMALCVVEATVENIAKVSAELEQDRVRAERVAQANAEANLQAVGVRFRDLLAQLSLSPGHAHAAPATARRC